MGGVVCLILCFLGQNLSAEEPNEKPQESSAQETKTKNSQKSKKPFSPLHNLVGIDPSTGQFVPPSERRTTSSDDEKDSASSQTGDTKSDKTPVGTAPEEEATRTLKEFADQIEELQQGEQGPLSVLNAYLGKDVSGSQIADWSRKLAWLTAGLFLLYPMGMVLSETVAFFWGTAAEFTESDRRYRRTRFWRRLVLAVAIAGLIVLLTLGTTNLSWWSSSTTLSLLGTIGVVLVAVIFVLSNLIKQAARDQTLSVMREIRQHQLELRKDVDELRKRMRQVTMSG